MKIQCDVYKGAKKEDVYLYVEQDHGLNRVPEEILSELGETELALTFELTADRVMAREDATLVLSNIQKNGFHLQLPPIKYK